MIIDLNDEHGFLKESQQEMLLELLEFAAKEENIEADAELSVTIVNNQEIQEINRDYRDKDRPTDVISFALEEEGEGETAIISEDMPRILGDVIISMDKAKEQATDYEHSLERELGFLAVHGFLHLLGYDHMNEADERKMFGRQDEILGAYGLQR